MRRKVLVVACGLLTLTTACSRPGRPAGNSFAIAACTPAGLIPQNQSWDCEGQYFEVLFTGLIEEDRATGNWDYGVAESISSEDQVTWTVKLKDGWTFHNGEPITAQTFVDTWNATAASPAVLKDQLSVIEGYDDLNTPEGQAPTATTMSGLKVIDRLTFQVRLVEPDDLNGWVLLDSFDPLPKAFFDLYPGNLDAWGAFPIGNGPYQMAEPWKGPGYPVKLKKYPGYRGKFPGLADRIQFRTRGVKDFDALEQGLVDIAGIDEAHFREAQREFGDRLVQRPVRILVSIYLPLYDRSYQSKELRQALSLALDRVALTGQIYQGTAVPAASLFPDGEAAHRDDACSYCRFDVVSARQKLLASGWSGPLDFYTRTEGIDLEAADAVAEQWRRNLGIEVSVHPGGEPDCGPNRCFTGPWWDSSNYGAGASWLRPYQSDAEFDWTGYSSPEFDGLVDASVSAGSDLERIRDLQKAEDIALEDMPVIPLVYPHEFIASSERVANVHYISDYIALELIQVVG